MNKVDSDVPLEKDQATSSGEEITGDDKDVMHFKDAFYYLGTNSNIFYHNPLFSHTLPCPSTCPSMQFAPHGLRRFLQFNFLLILPLTLVFELTVLDGGVSNANDDAHDYLVPQMIGALLVLALILLHFFASSTDPGILPPAKVTDRIHKDPIKIISEDGLEVEIDSCRTCRILRPPRSGHCKECDHCVSFFDHHCFVLEICIGERNLRLFIFWVFTAWIALGFAFVETLVVMIRDLNYEHLKQTNYGRWRIAACSLMVLISFSLWVLSCFPFAHYVRLSCIGALEKDVVNDKREFIKWWERSWSCGRFCERMLYGPVGPDHNQFNHGNLSRISEFYDPVNGRELVDEDGGNRERIVKEMKIDVMIADANSAGANEKDC